MSEIPSELEEGEIADDIIPEPIIEPKMKALPRRYNLNDTKAISKHKKNCKHAIQHHKRKHKRKFHSNTKLKKDYHKECKKYNVDRHSKLTVERLTDRKTSTINLRTGQSKYNSKNFLTKSAFKNYMSPPRIVAKVGNFNLSNLSPSENSDSFPRLLSEYKKSRNEQNKLKNISNLNNELPSKDSKDNGENVEPKQKPCENLGTAKIPNSDDEDEEVLRRLALATCCKRPMDSETLAEKSNSCETNIFPDLPVVATDNYEIIDMEVDNEGENTENVDDLFVIDTTPSYFSGMEQPSVDPLNQNFNNNIPVIDLTGKDFLSNFTVEQPLEDFSNDTFIPNFNNNLYSNFEVSVDCSRPQHSQLDDEFEEELLRAELIANMNSQRQKNGNPSAKDNIVPKNCAEEVSKDKKILKLNSAIEKITNVENKISKTNTVIKNERTVNTASDVFKTDNMYKERTVNKANNMVIADSMHREKARSVSVYPKNDSANSANLTQHKAVDIKVKLNNILSLNSGIAAPKSLISIPQERLIISLTNESSSDESEQEDGSKKKVPNKNSAVASLEALIINARHESDGKKSSIFKSSATSDAVSCLSKAQQEEYNSLIKILNEKQEPVLKTQQNKVVTTTENTALILLKKKMLIAKKNIEKEKVLINNVTKELMKKKRAYMVAKLRTQHLKEQLLAAEKVRKSNLQVWTKCSNELQTLKSSVSKRQAMINSLQLKINTLSLGLISNGLSPKPLDCDLSLLNS